VVAVHPGVPASSITQLIALAKAQPNRLNYGSSGTGGAPHLAGELFRKMAGVEMTHVPYKGLAPAVADLMGGQIQVLFVDVGIAMPQVREGKLRALAITSATRSAVAPELPTVAESGLPGYASGTWYGLFVPAGTPEAVVRRLTSDTPRALESAEVRERLVALGAEAAPMSGDAFRGFVQQESAKWAQLIREANIKVD
jgi:tripartite-type tricarboxylate transporter receptor subunit TctC